jgi:SAM-dependent methyltransferase
MLTRLIKGCSTLKSWAMRIASRAGVSNAKVALSRRLAVIMHSTLVDGTVSKRALGSLLLRLPPLWRAAVWTYNQRRRFRAIAGRHPVDARYGISTGGAIPGWLLGGYSEAGVFITSYVGCQPSCVRAALSSIDVSDQVTFVDLGCGLGRALVLASEFAFKRIVGVELSPEISRLAERNIQTFSSGFPQRTKPEIVQQDARTFSFPLEATVVFLFHPFGRPILQRIVEVLEERSRHGAELFVVYENPVHGDILDSQNWLKRWFAENVVADADELPFHSGVRGTGQESLVVWYSTTRKGKRRFLLALFPKSESESRQAPQSRNLQIAGAAGRARPAVFQTTLT